MPKKSVRGSRRALIVRSRRRKSKVSFLKRHKVLRWSLLIILIILAIYALRWLWKKLFTRTDEEETYLDPFDKWVKRRRNDPVPRWLRRHRVPSMHKTLV